jgi:UDP-glucose 4-epimerase
MTKADVEMPEMRGVRCLVLGGGGFLGIHVANALVAHGAVVRAFGRSLSGCGVLDTRVTWQGGRFDDQKALAEAAEGQEIVFHLISNTVPAGLEKDPSADLEANVLGTLKFLAICHAAAVRKVVFASSGGTIYGPVAASPITETAPTNPISAYGVGKLAIEKYLALYRHLYGLDYAVLRIANAYGPLQSAFKRQGVVAAMLHRAFARRPLEIWGTGEVVRDFIHVEDVVAALSWLSVYDGPHRVMNVGSGLGRSIDQVASDIESILGTGDVPRIYHASRSIDVPVNILDIGLITSETPWRPRWSWQDGLRDTIRWTARTWEASLH